MRLDNSNYTLGDRVFLEGAEVSPSEINYADTDAGEIAFLVFADRAVRTLAVQNGRPVYNVCRGTVKIAQVGAA